jgi:hypothetical protein
VFSPAAGQKSAPSDIDLGFEDPLITVDLDQERSHDRAEQIGMPEEREPVKGVFSLVGVRVRARVIATGFGRGGSGVVVRIAVCRHLVPLVRWAALWGVLGHAFATPSSAGGVAWCFSA